MTAYVAPKDTKPNEGAWERLGEAMGLTGFEAERLAHQLSGFVLNLSPKDELLHRLNLSANGTDPGEPYNWRGARALYGMWQETVKAQSSPELVGLKNPDRGHKR